MSHYKKKRGDNFLYSPGFTIPNLLQIRVEGCERKNRRVIQLAAATVGHTSLPATLSP